MGIFKVNFRFGGVITYQCPLLVPIAYTLHASMVLATEAEDFHRSLKVYFQFHLPLLAFAVRKISLCFEVGV